MEKHDIRSELASQISELPDDKLEMVADYLRELSDAENGRLELSDKYFTFWSDGQLFGIPVMEIVQILQLVPLSPLPNYPAYVKGVLSVRDEMVPIIDFRLRFGRPETPAESRACIIVVHAQGHTFGLIVDGVSDVKAIPEHDICPPPQQGGKDAVFLTGIAKLEQIILLLSTDFFLGDDEVSVFFDAETLEKAIQEGQQEPDIAGS